MATTNRSNHRERIVTKTMNELAKKNESLAVQDLLDHLQDEIIGSLREYKNFDQIKSVWTRAFKITAKSLKVVLVWESACWNSIQDKINEALSPSNNAKESTNGTSLKTSFTENEKQVLKKTFDSLDKNKFWVLKATIEEAAERGEQPESVEEKILKFALQCNFHHPSQSWILDTSDENWNDMFSPEEMKEINDTGRPLLPPTNELIQDQLNELAKLKTTKEAYKFAQQIKHDPSDDPLLAWFVITLLATSLLFIQNVDVDGFMETDKQYRMFGFVNNIYVGSDIAVYGKEKSSKANAAAANKKRKLSAINEIQRKATGRKMDAVYVGGRKELGCMETGSNVDQTKELKDGFMKMPIVMKDMLLQIAEEAPSLLHDIDITGFVISGDQINMLGMDVPKGYITRIRRTNAISFPSNNDDFVVRMMPLIKIATAGKQKMERTLALYRRTEIPLEAAIQKDPILPPCLFLSSLSLGQESSSSSPSTTTTTASSDNINNIASSSSSSKKQKQDHIT